MLDQPSKVRNGRQNLIVWLPVLWCTQCNIDLHKISYYISRWVLESLCCFEDMRRVSAVIKWIIHSCQQCIKVASKSHQMSKHKQGRNRTSRGYLWDIQITLERASVGHHFHHASATTTDITSHTASQTISLSPAHPTKQINVVVKPYRGLMFVQIPV